MQPGQQSGQQQAQNLGQIQTYQLVVRTPDGREIATQQLPVSAGFLDMPRQQLAEFVRSTIRADWIDSYDFQVTAKSPVLAGQHS